MVMDIVSGEPQYIRARVANACDGCKSRKVKCDGNLPCSYCTRRQRPHTCHYSPPQQRRRPRHRHSQTLKSPPISEANSRTTSVQDATLNQANSSTISERSTRRYRTSGVEGSELTPRTTRSVRHGDAEILGEEHDETEVPREARLLCDAQGKLIFIGDCAPLSFFQTVRQLVTSKVDQNAFAPQTSRYSVLENASSGSQLGDLRSAPDVAIETVQAAVPAYLAATAGLVDLFEDNARLLQDLTTWVSQGHVGSDNIAAAVNYLVVAIGCQRTNEDAALRYFEFARDQALANLSGNLSVATVQAFTLVTLYMLRACQINGAFLFFGIAVRTAYSIGIHRTEVNTRFGHVIHKQRDRLWISLRIVDLFLSTSMGRPPATSDVDCTVPYRTMNADGEEDFDILNASAQIFLIIEGIVLEVYSRKKISPQLTEGISRELREFSIRWLQQLKDIVAAPEAALNLPEAHGACQVISSYYYAVMLVSRPFLMYEMHRRLSPESHGTSIFKAGVVSGKSKLADACIDAASLMTDLILDLIERSIISERLPVLVSWLFAASLVLGVGLLGSFGRILEKYTRMSILALELFAKNDAHAMQYSLIAKSLLTTALEYLEKKEARERHQRTENSSQLFGLIPRVGHDGDSTTPQDPTREQMMTSPTVTASRERYTKESNILTSRYSAPSTSSPFADLDSSYLCLPHSAPRTPDLSMLDGVFEGGADSSFGALNLFPLLEGGGHIDLAHYF